MRIDGELREIAFGLQLDRYKTHDIEIVIDRIEVNEKSAKRLSQTVQTALKHGKGLMQIMEEGSDEPRYFSRLLMCPTTGLSYDEPEPNTFSFNSPYGACPKCNGLGRISEVDLQKIIPDNNKNIRKGGLAPIGEYKNNWIFNQLEAIGIQYNFTLDTPLKDIPDEAIDIILYGANRSFDVKKRISGRDDNLYAEF